MMAKRMYVAAVLIGLVVWTGCLFEPREAEDPSTSEDPTWITPNTPKDVFANLASGLAASTNSNYERSLDADFTFIPLTEVVVEFPEGTFDGWNKDIEMDMLTNLKGLFLGERTIQFGDEDMVFDREDIDVNTAEFEGEYVFTLDRGDGSDVETYAGRAIFYLMKQTQGWMLKTWEDIDVSGSYPTSGYIRGTFKGSS
jgi:hypothetical protein